jgi:DNA-directed RNA polymerase beta subunit
MIRATVPRIKADIPLFILFRALGVLADKDIYELILGTDNDTSYDPIITESILEASSVVTQDHALSWIGDHTNTWSVKSQKQSNVHEILSEELFPHIGGHEMNYEKACFLAHLTRKAIWTSSKRLPTDDRDAYPNKRVDIPGFLLADLFRKTYNNRMVKDMKAALSKEIHGGSWKATGNWTEIVNINNINKIVKSTILDVCLKSSLATGNFGSGKIGGPSKIGVSQVLNRMNYSATISHLRRISTPIEKTGKLIAPRKQHNTQIQNICPCETPEGHGVGVTKNMASMAGITIFSSPVTVYSFLHRLNKLVSLRDATMEQLHQHTRVFLNGSWIGVLLNEDTVEVVDTIRMAKRSGKIHIYTGIVWKIAFKELWMTTEAGRVIRPVYYAAALREIAADKTGVMRQQVMDIKDWNQLLLWETPTQNRLFEYMDAGEVDCAFIAMDYDNCIKDPSHTHCEIHPSTMLGTTASCIPFPDHNQSPRNAYQCLWENEEVLMASGERKVIKDVAVGEKVVSFDPVTGRTESVAVINQYVRETDKTIYKLTTHSGREVVATDNHPFITEEGWKSVGDIYASPNRKVGIIPNWLFLDTNVPAHIVAISKEQMAHRLEQYGVKESLITKHLLLLGSLGLCPLYADDARLPMLARMLGFIQTDGSINVYEKHSGVMCQVGCDFGEEKDAHEFEKDVASLGFQTCHVRMRNAEIHGYKMSTYNVNHNGAFASLVACLGATLGRNTEVERLPIPAWIMAGSDNVKREFLGGIQGGDGCKIRYNRTEGNQNFVCAETTNQIFMAHKDSLITFMTQVLELFTHFGVEAKVVEHVFTRAANRHVVGVKLADKSDNLIRYYDVIGYRYDTRKITDSFKTVEYLKYKARLVKEHVRVIQSVREDMEMGLTRQEIAEKYRTTVARVGDIERAMKLGREITMRRLEDHEYCDVVCEQMTVRDRIVFVPVLTMEVHDRVRIADITVDNQHHSFITSHNIGSHNSSMAKQAMGIYAMNFRDRFDAITHVLSYPEIPMVSTYMSRFYGAQSLPAGQNVIVAIMTYTGYNQEDSNMFNRAALDRGRFRSIFYRTYKDEERKNQSSGEEEKFCHPDPMETKHMKNAHYDKLGEDGVVPKDTYVTPDDVLIGKVVPLRVPTGAVLPAGVKKQRDVSKLPRNNESGYVDKIYKNRNGEGYNFVKIRMRQDRIPEIGDKFSSRHGQKGTMGMILNPEDMPQTASGIVPDIIINPHAIPSRMTVAQLMETLMSKIGCMAGCLGDGSPFGDTQVEDLATIMRDQYGMEPYGNEIMYNGYTGRMMETSIFIGPCYYQRLRHCSADKMHSRASGPLVMLTRQPAEGRAREGGLRFGKICQSAA